MSLSPTVVPWTEPVTETLTAHPFAPAQTLVIYNPDSGTALSKTRVRRLLSLLGQRGYRVAFTDNVAQSSAVARNAASDGIQAAIIIGGDGTLYGTIARLPAHVRIAYYPGGTANLFALNWRIPRSPEAWIKLLDAGRTAQVRLGLCHDRPFASVGSVGFDATVVHGTREPLKKMLAGGAYALEFIHSYLAYNTPRFQITIDGEPFQAEDVLGIIIGRGPHYGGPFRVLPADPQRPELAYAILTGRSKSFLAKFAVGMLFETLSRMQGVTYGTAQEILVEAEPSACVQLDGDACGNTPARFTVEDCERTILA